MQNLKVATIQSDLFWEDVDKNISQFEIKIKAITSKIDLIILPETFTTGFSMKTEKLAEKMDGKTVSWLQKMAKEKNACILGSLIILENDKYYNRLICAFADGKILHYDKRHLFTFGNEHKHFEPGTERLVFEINGFKICPLICYDLRFPVWSRNTENIDLFIYVANWPDARIFAWDTLLKSRAIENVSYVIGCNRVGKDGFKKSFVGNSTVLNYTGKSILEFSSGENQTGIVELNKEKLVDFRKVSPALADGDFD